MSTVRTAIRLLAVEALKGNTIALGNVYDSRMADLSPDTFSADAKPVILAITDKDEGAQLSEQNGGPPFGRSVELSLELGMVQKVLSDDDEASLLYPNTDARLEAALDFLELQVIRHLSYAENELCALFRRFWRITKVDSHRQIFEETAQKVAARVMTLTCYGGDDKIILYNTSNAPLPTGYDMLPDPLKSVAKLMPDGSSGKDVCDLMVKLFTNLILPPFTGMDNTIDAGNTTEGDVPSTEEHTVIDVATYP